MEEDSVNSSCNLVVIGGSAGSLEVLLHIVPNLHQNLQVPLVLVLHQKASENSSLVALLASKSALPVKEAEGRELIQRGIIYVAPPGYHLLIEKDRTFSLDASEKICYSRPSIDVTFESAADAFGPSLVCILLSGANSDGTNGLQAVRTKGGFVMVQDPDSAQSPFMPQHAIKTIQIDLILPKDEMYGFINKLRMQPAS